jgi:hypothetical protein
MAQLVVRRTDDREDLERGPVSWARLARATVLAALVAIGSTVALYALASVTGLVDRHVILPSPIGMGPLSLASVAATAAMATVGAGLLLGVLAASTRRPVLYFRVVASILAAISLLMPTTIPGPPLTMRLVMGGMHVIVWAVSVSVLARRPVRGSA